MKVAGHSAPNVMGEMEKQAELWLDEDYSDTWWATRRQWITQRVWIGIPWREWDWEKSSAG